MTKQEAQQHLKKSVELLLEVGKDWMNPDADVDWDEQRHRSYKRLNDAAFHSQQALEWFSQKEEKKKYPSSWDYVT